MKIEEAITMLREKYAENEKNKWVKNPVAYTLYEVWKAADAEKPGKETAERKNPVYDLLYEEGGANTT